MACVAVDKNSTECIYEYTPVRETNAIGNEGCWVPDYEEGIFIVLPKGSIKKLIGRELTWGDEPVELE